MVLRPAQGRHRLKTVSASLALAKRGLSLLQAKRAIEELLDKGSVALELPMVEDRSVFRDEMAAAGVDAKPGEEGD
jgi:putative transcriptional regulator